jgi:HPt (histidine-containing phosphotransfer) domain-containing protein
MRGFECFRSVFSFDEAALLHSVGDDTDFLDELVGLFLAACPTLLNQIRAALAISDFAALGRAARILKGALRSFPLGQATRAAEALETAACQQRSVAATQAFEVLEKWIKCLTSALSQLEELRTRAC